MEEADASRGHQEQGEDDVVHCGEVHLDYLPHDAAGVGGSGECTASGADHDVKESISAIGTDLQEEAARQQHSAGESLKQSF